MTIKRSNESRHGRRVHLHRKQGLKSLGSLESSPHYRATPFCANSKSFLINDPTDEAGITITVKGKTNILLPGDILKLTDVKTVSESSYVVESKNLIQYHSFSYDYNQHTNFDESAYLEHPFEENEKDEKICETLEKWLSADLLSRKFNQLQQVPSRRYIDFVAQVVEQRMMRKSVVISLWDGTNPGTSTEDPYKSDYACNYTQCGNDYTVRVNQRIKDFLPMNKYVYVNVWRNTSELGNEHFQRAAHFLGDGNDLLVMFNVEVAPSSHGNEYPIQLNMRSGHHQGKAVRVVKRHSILGKSFTKILEKEMEKFVVQGDISDGDILDEDTEAVGAAGCECTQVWLRSRF